MASLSRIVCISNRLPVSAYEEEGNLEFHPSSGGLVTGLAPILRKSRGIWIGWPGSTSASHQQVIKTLAEFSNQSEFELFPVMLDQDSVAGFYQGFSNQIIWPLFHDLQSRCNFEPDFWSTYLNVQKMFAVESVKHIRDEDLVWVHDFHLMGLGRALRKEKLKNKIGFFFHTPFPGPDIFLKLPWRADVIDSMLDYDTIGFQTRRDLKNFIYCLELLTDSKCTPRGASFSVKNKNGYECILGSFPISIDFNEFDELARSPEVSAGSKKIREDMNSEFLILSIDRLDYTKGIPYRIRAFKRLLEIDPSLKRRIVLLQVVVPSRIEVPEYQQLRSEIDQLVSQVNGTLGEPGWVPVHHLFRSLTREEVIAMYRASDVVLVTPLKDGMNLVAKEYCASRFSNNGALVLSEFAGAADELGEYAFLVNPYDIDGVAKSLALALASARDEKHVRMANMRDIIKQSDVYHWATSFLNSAGWSWPQLDSTVRPITIWEQLKRIANVFDI